MANVDNSCRKYKNVSAYHIRSAKLKSNEICALNIMAENITSKTLLSTTIVSDSVKTKNITTENITATNLIEGNDIKVDNFLYLFQNRLIINVGPTREYKNLQDVMNSLANRIILQTVIIKVDPGIYDGFAVAGFDTLNNNAINIEGDMRTIAGQTFINKSGESYYTFLLSAESSGSRIKIIENSVDLSINVQILDLVVGDKVVYYIDDLNIPKRERFIEATVIEVLNDSFLLDKVLPESLVETAITFLPNVYIKATYEQTFVSSNPVPPIFPYKSNVLLLNPANLSGFTFLEPDTFSLQHNIANFSSGITDITSCVVLAINWAEVDIDNVRYEGFKSPGAFYSAVNSAVKSQNSFYSFTILGTGFTPSLSFFGPLSFNDSDTSLESVYMLSCIENSTANGILFFYNTSCTLSDIAILGCDAVVNFLASKSIIYNSSLLLSRDCHIGVISADDSFVELDNSIIENYDIGAISETLSRMIFRDLTLVDGTTDFCINDLSAILRDGVVIVASPCL